MQKVAESTATAINSTGEVAGMSGKFGFCYDISEKEPMVKLGNKFVGTSRAFAMNDYDEMVGDATFSAKDFVSRAALFYNGSVMRIGPLDSGTLVRTYSRANGMNASGQVVGFLGPTKDGANSRAFIWSKAMGMLDMGTLGGAYAQAFAINDAGFVTGNAQLNGKAAPVHAFIYDSLGNQMGSFRGMRDLGTLGGSYSYGMAINAKNTVVGYSTTDKYDKRIHAFIHDDSGKMRDLGTLGGTTAESDRSFALGVNAYGEVVGFTYLPAGPKTQAAPQVAFIFVRGVMMNLNDLIGDASNHYWLQSAVAINNKGQIAANALDYSSGYVHAVLLTRTGIQIGVDTN